MIIAITTQGLTYREAARLYGVSKSLVHTLYQRYLAEGEVGILPRSRAPHTCPGQTPKHIRERILELRDTLLQHGSDAGADTIRTYLAREHVTVSRTTIWRILQRSGAITPQPQKRPRSSWQRFQASQPNEMWQSDFTHHRLTTGHEIEIIGWLDDHSRFLLHLSAHPRVTGRIVVDTFTQAAHAHGFPAATLTDNGMVYIIERFWQTLKKYLAQHNAASITELQTSLDRFSEYYNTIRPHRAIARNTPQHAYTLIPKAAPTRPDAPDSWQVRYDIVGTTGTISLHHAGRLRHLGIGRENARTEIICLVHAHHATESPTPATSSANTSSTQKRTTNEKHPNPHSVGSGAVMSSDITMVGLTGFEPATP
nr:DDE-type integrase/transposase/recombinase [Leucobacter manosquensis]